MCSYIFPTVLFTKRFPKSACLRDEHLFTQIYQDLVIQIHFSERQSWSGLCSIHVYIVLSALEITLNHLHYVMHFLKKAAKSKNRTKP